MVCQLSHFVVEAHVVLSQRLVVLKKFFCHGLLLGQELLAALATGPCRFAIRKDSSFLAFLIAHDRPALSPLPLRVIVIVAC